MRNPSPSTNPKTQNEDICLTRDIFRLSRNRTSRTERHSRHVFAWQEPGDNDFRRVFDVEDLLYERRYSSGLLVWPKTSRRCMGEEGQCILVEESSQFCTIRLSKEKDPNQDITRRFAWETSERRPNWNPKSCQLQIDVFKLPWNGEGKKNRHAVSFEWSFHTHDIVLAIMVVSNLKTLESRCDIQCTVRKFTSYRPTSQGKLLALKVTVPSSASRCELETRVKPSGTSPSHSSSYTGSHMPIEAILVTSLDLLAPTYDASLLDSAAKWD